MGKTHARGSRRSPTLEGVEREEFLKLLGECRRKACDQNAKLVIFGDLYTAMSSLTDAIDQIALRLTGQKNYFWEKGFSMGGIPSQKDASESPVLEPQLEPEPS